jgi:hypothetical protein
MGENFNVQPVVVLRCVVERRTVRNIFWSFRLIFILREEYILFQ